MTSDTIDTIYAMWCNCKSKEKGFFPIFPC